MSTALLDDPDSPCTTPSVNGSCSRSPEAVGVRSSDAASASLRGLVSTISGYDDRYTNYLLAIDDVVHLGSMWVTVIPFHAQEDLECTCTRMTRRGEFTKSHSS